MENQISLPERSGASDSAKDLFDAQAMADNSKPNSKAPAESNKPPKVKKEKAPKTPKPPKGPTPPKAKKEPTAKPSIEDPQSMFKVGFLSDVYHERPIGPDSITKVITRCKMPSRCPRKVHEFYANEFDQLSPPRAQWFPPHRS